MSLKIRLSILPLLLAFALHAQENSTSGSDSTGSSASVMSNSTSEAAPKNEIFFHPVFTLVSLSTDSLPLILALTYERHLENGRSFIWQQDLVVLPSQIKDSARISGFELISFLGLRNYFNSGLHKGFYIQGSGEFGFGSVKASSLKSSGKASGNFFEFGALGYLGYKWQHVFLDLGAGYKTAKGTLKIDNSQEIDLTTSGLALDFNLGFGFGF